jgi:hypothetical protein
MGSRFPNWLRTAAAPGCVYESGTRKRARMTTKRLVGDGRRQSCKLQNELVWALAVPLNVH